MKFCGTSVADPDAINRLIGIVGDQQVKTANAPLVVVSALSGVTDQLVAIAVLWSTIVLVAFLTATLTVSVPEKDIFCASGLIVMSYDTGTTSVGNRAAASAGVDTVASSKAAVTAIFMRFPGPGVMVYCRAITALP